jgi:hypothetical protein
MTTLPDGNAAMVRLIVTQTLEAERALNGEKKSASVAAWAGVVLSVLTIAFVAGSLSGDVAVAKTQADDATKAVAAIKEDIASIKATLDQMQKQQERERR